MNIKYFFQVFIIVDFIRQVIDEIENIKSTFSDVSMLQLKAAHDEEDKGVDQMEPFQSGFAAPSSSTLLEKEAMAECFQPPPPPPPQLSYSLSMESHCAAEALKAQVNGADWARGRHLLRIAKTFGDDLEANRLRGSIRKVCE